MKNSGMDVTGIPFVAKVGVVRRADGTLEIPFHDSNLNHVNTLHASAQFTLAETASGEMLQTLFPDLVGKVVPLLRGTEVKYKGPAESDLTAHPSVAEIDINKFREQIEKKGRASIQVSVVLKDSAERTTCSGEYRWFVQRLD